MHARVQGLHNQAGKWLFSESPMAEPAEGADQAAYLLAQRQAVDAMLQQVRTRVHVCVRVCARRRMWVRVRVLSMCTLRWLRARW